MLSRFSCVQLLETLWTVAVRLLCPWGFSRQEYWNGFPFPLPGVLHHPGIEPVSLVSPVINVSQGCFPSGGSRGISNPFLFVPRVPQGSHFLCRNPKAAGTSAVGSGGGKRPEVWCVWKPEPTGNFQRREITPHGSSLQREAGPSIACCQATALGNPVENLKGSTERHGSSCRQNLGAL